jgi:hypothetical protein
MPRIIQNNKSQPYFRNALMPRPPRRDRSCFVYCWRRLYGGCATPGRTTSDDPWQGMNRSIYKFNDAVDRATLKPMAKGYQKITPQWFRTGTRNFFNNLKLPWVMVNELLQGKPGLMAQQTCRFVLNSVVGLGGFIDVAGKLELSAQNEDFGQTLAVWGVPSGPTWLCFRRRCDGFDRVPDYKADRWRRYPMGDLPIRLMRSVCEAAEH